MCTTTKLDREIAHIDNSYRLAILLTKECHCPCLLCFLQAHNLCYNRKILSDFLIDNSLYLLNFFLAECLVMCKVKPETILIYIGTCLLDMSTENCLQCLLQQMCCRMVHTGMQTLICIDRKLCCIRKLDLTIFYISNMCDLTTDNLDRIFDDELTSCCLDHTGIAALTTHSRIKWCLFDKNGTIFTFGKAVYDCIFACDCHDLRFVCQSVITNKLGCDCNINLLINCRIGTHIVGCLSCFSCTLALFLHTSLEAFLICSKSGLFQNFDSQIKRESISIIQLKCMLARKSFLSLCLHIFYITVQDRKSLINRLVEVFFLCI